MSRLMIFTSRVCLVDFYFYSVWLSVVVLENEMCQSSSPCGVHIEGGRELCRWLAYADAIWWEPRLAV